MALRSYVKGDTKNLSKNFKVPEFMCKGGSCCTSGKIDGDLVTILQKIRDHFGKPVHICSAYRCKTWNKKVGGVSGSYHLSGRAADIKVEDTAPAEVAKYAESIGVLGIGLYETSADGHFVHVDTRAKKSYWYGQKQQKRATFGGTAETAEKTEDGCQLTLQKLRKGCAGEDVRALQILLKGRGYDCGTADGSFGAKTEAAVERYQHDHSLAEDGIAGRDTMSSLLGVA